MSQQKLDSFLAALEFWMGVECLSPNSAPKKAKEGPAGPITWAVSENAQLPWINAGRKSEVAALVASQSTPKSPKTSRYVAYCGLIPMAEVTERIRDHFGVEITEADEPRRAEPVATLALQIDAEGYVTGTPFISSLPWAVGLVLGSAEDERLDFSGFFGEGGFEEGLQEDLQEIMRQMCLIEMEKEEGQEAMHSVPASGQGGFSSNGTASLFSQPASVPQHTLRPITADDIRSLCDYIYDRCNWSPEPLKELSRFQVRSVSKARADSGDVGNLDLLHSFFVEDLGRVYQHMRSQPIGKALSAFLDGELRADRSDIRHPQDITVDKGVLPNRMPLGCWPSKHGLVHAQQYAVNTIMDRLRNDSGVFSVNGPPGTGKTTLLRDVVAAIVVERAQAMSSFNHPDDAFTQQVKVDGWKYGKVWRLADSLCGHGIVVGSSNNGAVENITKELPSISAIPEGYPLRYMAPLSDSIAAPDGADERKVGETWGLMAAVMGSKQNRNTFFQRMRWPEYADPQDQRKVLTSLWMLVQNGVGKAKPWAQAVEDFDKALYSAQIMQMRMQAIAVALYRRRSLAAKLRNAERDAVSVEAALVKANGDFDSLLSQAKSAAANHHRAAEQRQLCEEYSTASDAHSKIVIDLAKESISDLERNASDAEEELAAITKAKDTARGFYDDLMKTTPGFWSRLVGRARAEKWDGDVERYRSEYEAKQKEEIVAEKKLKRAQKKIQDHQKMIARAASALQQVNDALTACKAAGVADPDSLLADEQLLPTLEKKCQDLREQYEEDANRCHMLQTDLWQAQQIHKGLVDELAPHEELIAKNGISDEQAEKWLRSGMDEEEIQLSSPWFDQEFFEARQAVFSAAMELHESFVYTGWSKIRTTLAALESINKGDVSIKSVHGGVSQIWETFFLLVPVISTTFASFPRMFNGWGSESIGWLLIDEAGQAAPQQAVGAIWRSKRVVVVGDPLQIKPVVSMPKEIIYPLMERCIAKPIYDPSESSVQVLADLANTVGTHIGDGEESTWVGSPLRVHRRCLNPMFDVANTIAYDGLMVHGTNADNRHAWFGPSCWIDIPATTRNGNSVKEQIDVAVKMVRAFDRSYGVKRDGKFNLYVISPYRDVNNALYDALGGCLQNRNDQKGLHGTVHTFQGKEADVVILVLGGTQGSISSYAAASPNLLNVALTRAKKRVYVIGDLRDYRSAPYFSELAKTLPHVSDIPPICEPDMA